jgi:hypothetical protein
LAQEVARFAKRRRIGPSEALRAIVAEWAATARYPAIEFRDGPVGRRPGLRGGPDVWEIAMVGREKSLDVAALCEHFSHVSPQGMEQALAYRAEHREEVDAWVEENERLGEELEREHRQRARA